MLLRGIVWIYLFFFAGILVGSWLKPFQVQRYWYAFGLLFALSLAYFGYQLNPDPGLDISRLNALVDTMRLECDTLAEALEPTTEDHFGSLVFFRILCFFVSRFPTNRWLPVISNLITVTLVFSVLVNYLRSENHSTRMLLPSLAIIFMGMQLQYVFSGVRNAMAVAFAITGLYLIFYKRRAYIPSILLFWMAATTHPMVLVLIPVVLLCRIPKGQPIFCVLGLCVEPIIVTTAQIMIRIPLGFLQDIGSRMLMYMMNSYMFDRPEMIANTIMFLVIILCYALLRWIGKMPEESIGWRRYMNAYVLLGCIMIGCMGRRDFTLRIGYIMGVAAVPLLCRLLERIGSDRSIENKRTIQAAVLLVSVALLVCCAKVYYDTAVGFAWWDFSGE